MFTSDAAKIMGITPKALRTFLRTRSKGVGSGARYEFSHEEVERLSNEYWASQHEVIHAQDHAWLGDGGRRGLPHEWLADPGMQAEFVAERQVRLERMSRRLREVGLGVPQMTEKDLKINGRALASALLVRSVEDE